MPEINKQHLDQQEVPGDDLTLPNVGLKWEEEPPIKTGNVVESNPGLEVQESSAKNELEADKTKNIVEFFDAETESMKARVKILKKEKKGEESGEIGELKFLQEEIERRQLNGKESKARKAIQKDISILDKKIKKGVDVENNKQLRIGKEQELMQVELARIERYEKEKEAEKVVTEEKLRLETLEKERQQRKMVALETLQGHYIMDRDPADREKAFTELTEDEKGESRNLVEEAVDMTDRNFTARKREIIRTREEGARFFGEAMVDETERIKKDAQTEASEIFWRRNPNVANLNRTKYYDNIRKKLGADRTNGDVLMEQLIIGHYVVEEAKQGLLNKLLSKITWWVPERLSIPNEGGEKVEFSKKLLQVMIQEENVRRFREAQKRAKLLVADRKNDTAVEDRMSEANVIQKTVKEYRIQQGDLLDIREKDISSVGNFEDLCAFLEQGKSVVGTKGKEHSTKDVVATIRAVMNAVSKTIPAGLDVEGQEKMKEALWYDPLVSGIPRVAGLREKVIKFIFETPSEIEHNPRGKPKKINKK